MASLTLDRDSTGLHDWLSAGHLTSVLPVVPFTHVADLEIESIAVTLDADARALDEHGALRRNNPSAVQPEHAGMDG